MVPTIQDLMSRVDDLMGRVERQSAAETIDEFARHPGCPQGLPVSGAGPIAATRRGLRA